MQKQKQKQKQKPNRGSKRTATACVSCRRSKIKCSGELPCLNCNRRGTNCYFSDSSTKILVSERYLRDLENYARSKITSEPSGHNSVSSELSHETSVLCDETSLLDDPGKRSQNVTEETDLMLNIWTSPFTLPSTIIKDKEVSRRNWLWLAPTSPWSFVARLTVMMGEKLNMRSQESLRFHLEGDIYPLNWGDLHTTTQDFQKNTPLPSVDQAIHAFNAVQFYLGQIYRLFNEDFPAEIRYFYERRAVGEGAFTRMWFVQLLLVLAFGKVFSSRTRTERDPLGSKLFLQAMSIMPSETCTGKDSLTTIENLALISLYLYSIDHREGAHSHIGQAIRIAQLEGLHTQLPEKELGYATVSRCRNIWWTLYIIDRQISSALGLPMIVQDADISTLVNLQGDALENRTLGLQVRLSQMMSFILSKIFKTEKTQLGHFLDLTREILQTMARLAEEIEDTFPTGTGSQASMDTVSHEMRHIILLYHQCVIIATRPLLLSVLKERMEKLDQPEEEWHKFLILPRSLVSIGIKSAVKSLEILYDESITLETFLPFDLEFTFSAALHLTIAHTLFQYDSTENHHTETAHRIFEQLVSSGNRVAEVRRTELIHIQFLFEEFSKRIGQQWIQTLQLSSIIEEKAISGSDLMTEEQARLSRANSTTLEWPVGSVASAETLDLTQDPLIQGPDYLEAIGISSNEFLAIVDSINTQDTGHRTWDPQPDWLTGGTSSFHQDDFVL